MRGDGPKVLMEATSFTLAAQPAKNVSVVGSLFLLRTIFLGYGGVSPLSNNLLKIFNKQNGLFGRSCEKCVVCVFLLALDIKFRQKIDRSNKQKMHGYLS